MHKLKLKLNPEMLVVESFAPRDGDAVERGTVNANASGSTQTRGGANCHYTDQGWETCPGFSCIEKCVLSWCPLDCGL